MGNSLPAVEDQKTFTSAVESQPKVRNLLRRLLECVGEELTPDNLLQKNEPPQEVVLDVCFQGVRYTLTRSFPQTPETPVNLSPREQEIVRLVARGHPNKVIAAVLEISPWTVSTHLRRVFAKLGVNSRAEMVARVLNEELLSMSE